MGLRVRNWRSFQHYQTRRPPWVKLHRTLLDDYEFIRLPIASQALAPRLWLLASESDEGELPDDPAKLAFRLHCTQTELLDALKPLIDHGFIEGSLLASTTLAWRKQDATPERETEAEAEREGRQSEQPALPPPPEQRAEKATTDTIHSLQLRFGSLLARLSEHPQSRQMVPAWCRACTEYTKADGTKVRGVSDFRTIQSIEKLERSIADAEWHLAELDKEAKVGA